MYEEIKKNDSMKFLQKSEKSSSSSSLLSPAKNLKRYQSPYSK